MLQLYIINVNVWKYKIEPILLFYIQCCVVNCCLDIMRNSVNLCFVVYNTVILAWCFEAKTVKLNITLDRILLSCSFFNVFLLNLLSKNN